MAKDLTGTRVAFVVANEGVEQVELTEPWRVVKEAGGEPLLVAPRGGTVQAFNHLDKGDAFPVDVTTADVSLDDFDAVVLPGGVANPDQLRMDAAAVDLVRRWVTSDTPVAAICQGPWTLVEAGVLRGRTLTSWPSLQTDIRNAGATWVDEEVHVDSGLVTSRRPADIPAFTEKMIEEFREGRHRRRAA